MQWKRKIVSAATLIGGSIIFWPGSTVKALLKSREEGTFSHSSTAHAAGEDWHDTNLLGWFPSVQRDTSIHWKLLKLSKSKNRRVRHKALKSLAEMPLLHDWQRRMIAQACDSRTAVGLARISNIKSSFFLPPPFKDLENDHIKKDLLELLRSLPKIDHDMCLKQFSEHVKSIGDNIFEKHEEWNSEFEDSYNVFRSERRKKNAFEKLCLQALLIHSSVESHRLVMHNKGILKLLLSVSKLPANQKEYQSLIGQILANFSLEGKYEVAMHKTGWIGILASWSQSPHIEVSLPAAKALANLDRDDFHHTLYENGVYLLHPLTRQKKEELSADVIFVHGLMGATFWTWRQHDSRKHSGVNLSEPYTFCWPKDWLASDVGHIRVMSIDYSTCISQWLCPQEENRHNLDAKACQLIEKLLVSNVGQKPIIWVTHSMGGLLVKQMLVLAEKSKENKLKSIASNTKGIIFFSVPHKGSDLASIFQSAPYIFQPSVDMRQLYKGSPVLLSLHERFSELVERYNINILSYGETKKSKWGLTARLLVTEDSSDPGLGEFYPLPVDHLSSCKPLSQESKLYSKIMDFILESIQKSCSPKYSKIDVEVMQLLSSIH